MGIALMSLSAATNLWAQAFTDLTSRFAVTKSGLVLNRATNTFNSVVTLTNVSGGTVKGPLVLLVSNVTAGSVTLANQSGQSAVGLPYLTVPVPAGGLAPGAAISNVVLAFSNPTRVAFTFNLAVASMEGVLLPGPGSAPAVSATTDLPEAGVDLSLIQNGVFLSRLLVTFAPGATVDQINRALAAVGGGIVSMTPGLEFVTVAVPVQLNAAALETLAAAMRAAPGILWAFPAYARAENQLPVSPSAFQDQHLLPTRFPAAWNTIDLARRNCLSQPKVPVLVLDSFGAPAQLPAGYTGFSAQVPGFQLLPAGSEKGTATHGYDVTTTMSAAFDTTMPTGANPVTECLAVTGVQLVDAADYIKRISDSLPSGRFIANFSQGFDPTCPTNGAFQMPPALSLAQDAVAWIKRTSNRWNEFLIATAAGNCFSDKSAQVYPGHGEADYGSVMAIAAGSDPLFGFMVDHTLWDATDASFPNVTASFGDQIGFMSAYLKLLQPLVPEDNVIVAGSTTPGATFNDLAVSSFSNEGASVMAVGENVHAFKGSVNGTSFAAPQVAGLASYLWLLSNDLRTNRPVSDTKAAIVQNTRPTPAGNTLDAYATILSLDAPGPLTAANAPIRLALLDVNNDGRFDETDVTAFLSKFLDTSGNPVEPAARDYSRWDLNGDGFTGGSKTEMFDLDRGGDSAQYGKTGYSAGITEQIEGKAISFNETQVTDMQVLCYYAYSALYTGDVAARAKLLGGCAGVNVTVAPSGANLKPGGAQQFSVTVTGTNDPRVTWTSTGGTISSTGFYTAGNAAGTFTVRATSVVDSSAFGEATVTIASNGQITGTHGPTFIGVCAKADVQIFTSGFNNPDVNFTIQGDARQTNKTIIGPTVFTTWAAGTTATGQIVLTATSIENPNASAAVTLRVDPFVAAYGDSSGNAFVVRGADANLPDDTYRLAVHVGYDGIFNVKANGNVLSGALSNGDSVSVTITPDLMQGAVQTGGTSIPFILTHNCAQ